MESQAQLSQQRRSQTPSLQTAIGVVPPTCLPNSICIVSTTTEGAPLAEGLPEEINGIWNSKNKK